MAGPPTSTFAQFNIIFAGDALPNGAVCTWGTGLTSAGGDPENVFDYAQAQFEVIHDTQAVPGVDIVGFELKVGPEATGPTFSRTTLIPGGNAGDGMGPQTAYLIRKRPTAVSNKFAGRFYYPGVSTAATTPDGQVTTAAIDAWRPMWSNFLLGWQAFVGNMFLFNGSSDPRNVAALEFQGTIATQRRRLRS